MTAQEDRPRTLAALRASGWTSRTVKAELRANLITRIRSGEPLFPGIVGYDKTVVPQLENAILSQHDFILLGLRGQAKTRILRQLRSFLDEWSPEIEGSEVHDDPFHPISAFGRRRLAECGDATPIAWVHRDERYKEKLATPDVSIVLMDIMMPEMDGYETIGVIRARPEFKRLPILALTAKAMKGDREKCLQAGSSDYIAKPVNTDQLLSLMRVWLHQ